MMTYEQDVIVPFPGSWWICRVNVCTAEEGLPHVTQSSGTPSQLQPHWHMSPTTGVLSNVQLSQCLTLCAMSKAWRVSVVLWTGSWWVRVNTAQSPAELLVKMEALISLYFSSVTETLIRAHANAQFIHLSGSTHSVLSLFHIIVPLNNTARRIYMPASIIPPPPNVTVTEHLRDDKPTSQSDPLPPPQLSLVTVETARRATSQIHDTHENGSTQGRSVDW